MVNIQMIGIDHGTAPVEIRERFAFTNAQSIKAMETLVASGKVGGCVILSTCNRTEVWVSHEGDDSLPLYEMLCALKGVETGHFEDCFVNRSGKQAVEYLFEMTSGLHSMIVGEDQILAQVKKALENARNAQVCDNVLEVLFRSAVTGAKRVKTDLSLSTANASAVELAIEKMQACGFAFAGRKCLVIGNGEMGKRTANALVRLGADVTVTVRQYRSGIVEIPENCSRINYGERYQVLPACDFIVSATSSPNVTIKYEDLSACPMEGEKIFIDLAVPRDIDPRIAELENVRLYDIDDFPVDATEELELQTRAARELLAEQEHKFISWYECRDLIPATGRIADYMAREVDLRVGSLVRDMGLDDGQNEKLTRAVDTAAGKVLRKLLFAVRDTAGVDVFRSCVEAMETTYGNA